MLSAAVLGCVILAPGTEGVPVYADKANLLVVIEQGVARAVGSEADWAVRRAHILANLQQVMGPLPAAATAAPEVVVDEETLVEGLVRRKIRYAAEPGDQVPAYLFLPPGEVRRPAVLCLHQTTSIGKGEPAGLGGLPNLHYALELARRGFVTLAPDYPRFGDYPLDVYARGYLSATMKGIVNHRRAVDLLCSLPRVDPARIGCLGHSLGGHNTLFVTAFDDRLRAAVTSCGFTAFPKYYGGDLTGWTHAGYMPRIAAVYGKDPARVPFDFPEVLAAIAPRPVFVNAPLGDGNFDSSGVDDCAAAARPVYRLLGNPDGLTVEHPDCGHDFPPDVRERAYAFLERALSSP